MPAILVQCVIVLYRQHPDEAKSLASLLEICSKEQSIGGRLRIFVQDNSPHAHPRAAGEFRYEYLHDPANPGLAAAYNNGMKAAKAGGAAWLLLLDQDTVLTRDFLLELLAAVQSDVAARVCAFLPKLVKGDAVLSPHTVRGFSYLPVPIDFSGLAAKQMVPCNSGSCVSIQAMTAVGGFPEEYWLDFLDFIVFHRLHAAGGRVFVLNSRLEHSLSLLNVEAEMSLSRHANMLAAEWRFVTETGSKRDALRHRLRLLKRAFIYARKLHNKAYATQTLRAVLQ